MQREKKWVLEPSEIEMEEGEREKLERKIEGNALEGELVMATPERGRINASLNKFENSPVFNYINNLSPLEMARPVRISQSFNSYSFSSIPSVFTSPHVSSIKGAKLLRRHSISGPSKPVCSSENKNKFFSNEAFADVANKSEEQKVSFHPRGYMGERFNGENMINGAPQNKNYGCHGSNESTVTCHDIDAKCVPSGSGGSSSSLVPFGQGGPNSGVSELNSEEGSLDCENFYDTADFLVFESPGNADPFKGFYLKPLDSETRLVLPEKTQDGVLVGVEINESENTLLQTGEGQLNEIEADGNVLTCPQVTEVSNEVISNEACNLPRGMKRRCLVFDMGGARRKFLNDGSSSSSSMLSERQIISAENRPNPSKVENISSRCIVPGIGLHLNALARTSKDHTVHNQEILATPRQLINDISSNAAPDSFANNEETINQSLALTSLERDAGPIDGSLHVTEDAYQLSAYVGSDDLNQSSPKKKKRKVENGGETDGCKRCNCKKSKCLKLYCECFAAGVYCVEPCSCQDCFNKPIHEETVLATRKQIESRNPLAFAPKVIRTTEFVPETVDDSSSTPASARHKRGCNCKKSGCLKKYCECYQGGVGCSINCRCEGCKNAFGRKEGSHIVLAEAEVEEMEKHEKSAADRNLLKPIIQNNAEPNQDSVLPETPMHPEREPLQHPFSSKNKPPRFVSMGSSSSTLYGGQKFGIPAFLQPYPKFEKRVPAISENEIPEILKSPDNGIKSSSPNNKRVSPPHCNLESSLSPARRTSRKLILQSIPSFPSLKD